MLTPQQVLRITIEIIFVLLGGLVVWLGLTGHILFDRRKPGWLLLSVAVILWGLRALFKPVELLTDELRRRVGGTYSLAELAAAYRDADTWARQAVADHAPSLGWPRDLSLVLAAAFHVYQRGATDFAS